MANKTTVTTVQSSSTTKRTNTVDVTTGGTFPVTGLTFWGRADAESYANNDPVSTFNDQSGSSHPFLNGAADTTVPTFKTNVINGLPVIRFDGNDKLTGSSFTSYIANSAYTVFIVAKATSVSTNSVNSYDNSQFIGDGVTGADGCFGISLRSNGDIGLWNYDGTDDKAVSSYSTSNFNVWSGTHGSNALNFYKDGNTAVTTASNNTTPASGTLRLGVNYIATAFLTGDIAEVMTYNTVLSTADRQLVEGYLAWKYGLEGNLPADHPWKSTDPGTGGTSTTANDLRVWQSVPSGAVNEYGIQTFGDALGRTNIAFGTTWRIQHGNSDTIKVQGDVSSVYFPVVSTTASGANAFLNSGSSPANSLLRSTSSLRYKTDIEDITDEYADKILQVRPIWYRSLATADNPLYSHYGLIAEELALIEPRLVQWGYLDSDYEEVEVDGRQERVIKEGAVKVPDGVQYDRLVVLLIDVVQRLEERVRVLENPV